VYIKPRPILLSLLPDVNILQTGTEHGMGSNQYFRYSSIMTCIEHLHR